MDRGSVELQKIGERKRAVPGETGGVAGGQVPQAPSHVKVCKLRLNVNNPF